MADNLPHPIVDLYASLTGRRSPGRSQLAWLVSWRRPFLGVLTAVTSVFVVLALLITSVDPYDNYSWGLSTKLARDRYNPRAVPWLLNIVSNSDYDTILIGGSTVAPFRPEDITRELTGTNKAFVVGYLAPRPRDLQVVFQRIARARVVRRVIVSFDVSYLHPADVGRRGFPFALYDDDMTNDLRAFGLQALRLSGGMLAGQTYDLAEWAISEDDARFEEAYRLSQTPEAVARARRVINKNRSSVRRVSPLNCRDFPALESLRSFVGSMATRGVRVDVLIPPFSYFVYYDWLEPNRAPVQLSGAPLSTLVTMRRCLLLALDGLPETRIFAYDLQPDIVEDMGNYRDPVHLQGTEMGRRLLAMMNRGEGQLTLGNFDTYASQLDMRVKNYTYFNSKLHP